MSLARAFSTRRAKQAFTTADKEAQAERSKPLKSSVGSIRNKISAPVQLVHTTNLLSYNAPDINSDTSSPSSSSAGSESGSLGSTDTASSSPPTSPDVAFRAKPSESKTLSTHFTVPTYPASHAADVAVPAIPRRALSHTKKNAYEALSRQRSMSRLSEQSGHTVSTNGSWSFSRSSSTSTRASAASHSSSPHYAHHAKASSASINLQQSPLTTPAPPPVQQHKKDYPEAHPFGQELAQVTEIAEEYGIKERLNVVNEEEQELICLGLRKFSPEEYLSEIRGIFANFFVEPRNTPAVWI